MHKAFLIFALLIGVFARAYAADELDLSFADEDEAAKDTSNQKLQVIATQGKDKNLDFSSIYEGVELDALPKPVQAPALGTRGYRPNLIALNYGERTPGVGAILEYSHNRIGMGLATSFRALGNDTQNFTHAYASYRMLPFRASPYILMGGGLVSKGGDSVGLLYGAGVEAQFYYGLTLLAGYTYYSAAHRGFSGGGIAWGF